MKLILTYKEAQLNVSQFLNSKLNFISPDEIVILPNNTPIAENTPTTTEILELNRLMKDVSLPTAKNDSPGIKEARSLLWKLSDRRNVAKGHKLIR